MRCGLGVLAIALFAAPLAAQMGSMPGTVASNPAPTLQPFAPVAISPVPANTMQIPAQTPPPADGGLFPVGPAAPPAKLWKGSFEAGANGATGNTEVLNVRAFWTADRKTDTNLFHSDMTYLLGKQDGVTNQQTLILNVRDERPIAGTPWAFYASSYVDYDELRDYKFYIGLYGGLSYAFSDTEDYLFKVRGGVGTLYKTGGPGDTWTAELNFGYDYRRQISDRGALISTLDYYPAFEDFSMFRLRFRLAYEHTLDPVSGCFFRTGLYERYDTNPGPGFQKSDLNYFITLGFNF